MSLDESENSLQNPPSYVPYIYFKLLSNEGEIVSCSRDYFYCQFSSEKNFITAAISSKMLDDGSSRERAIPVAVHARLFKKYGVTLLQRGNVAVNTKANAYNLKQDFEALSIPVEIDLSKKPYIVLRIVYGTELETASTQSHCPEGYVLVPGNPDYSTPTAGKDFCVMDKGSCPKEIATQVLLLHRVEMRTRTLEQVIQIGAIRGPIN